MTYRLSEGTKVISLNGEHGKTVSADNTYTGKHAVGIIDEAVELDGGEFEYVVTFDGDVTRRIHEADLFDRSRYDILD